MRTILRNILYFILLIATLTLANGCYYDINEELYPVAQGTIQCDTTNTTYSTRVLTIIQNQCYACHSGTVLSGNVNLQGYTNLKTYAENGKLMGAINHASGYVPMPPGGGKLNSCDIAAIQRWINTGMLNN